MTTNYSGILSSFSVPMDIANSPASLLWIIPLVIFIAAVYKATKFDKINIKYIKETAILIGTILGFMLLIAVGLSFVVEWLT